MSVALRVKAEQPDVPCIFITKDTNLRIRADGMGLDSENYEERGFSIDELYPGAAELRVDSDIIDELYQAREVTVAFRESPQATAAYENDELTQGLEPSQKLLYANEYVRLVDRHEESHTAMARLLPQSNKIVALATTRPGFSGCWGIKPRNKEQHFALDCLLDDNIKLVTLLGKAGTGKTLIALAAGLQKATEEQAYSKLLVARPIFPLGKDVGYLPGGIEDKLNPWMQPIFDNVEFLMGLNEEGIPQIINENGEVTTSDINFQEFEKLDFLKYEGPVDPPYTGGFGNTFRWKNWHANVFITYSFGNKLRLSQDFAASYSDLDAMPKEFKNRWVKPGDELFTDVPAIASRRQYYNDYTLGYAYNAYNYSTARIADGGFIRLKEVSLTYDVPKTFLAKIRVKSASLKLQATNLCLLYADKKLNGQDPEFFNSGGVASPMPRQFTFTLRFGL